MTTNTVKKTKQNNFLSNKILFPFLIAVFPILSLFGSNIDQTETTDLIIPLLLTLLATLAVYLINRTIVKNDCKAGLMTSLLLLLFFTYGHIHGILYQLYSEAYIYKADFKLLKEAVEKEFQFHVFLIVLYILIAYSLAKRIKTLDTEFKNIVKIMNITAVVLVLTASFNIASYKITQKDNPKLSNDTISITQANNSQLKRDIYYIVLDAYARADILKKYYKHDNSGFTSWLEDQGFYVAENSRTNYIWTFLSLPSSLNFQYLDDLITSQDPSSNDLSIPYEMIRKNKVVDFLKKQGYSYIHFNSTWGATRSNSHADREICSGNEFFRNEFYRILAETTALRVFNSIIYDDLASSHLYNFEQLKKIPDNKEPTFSFAHFILPHYPFIFDRNGQKKNVSRVDQFSESLWSQNDNYVEQVIFVNKKIKEVVSAILKKSEVKPIIIIASDHGPFYGSQKEAETINGRTANLAALYLPEIDKSELYPEITPVNYFRLVFKNYFGAKVDLLEDKIFFSPFSYPYQVQELKGLAKFDN
jgi:hypothetical protein